MNGYIKILNKDIPFYMSLAEDGYKKCNEEAVALYERLNSMQHPNWSIINPSTWFYDDTGYYEIHYDYEIAVEARFKYSEIKRMLAKARDKSIYIDIESYNLLEDMNHEN